MAEPRARRARPQSRTNIGKSRSCSKKPPGLAGAFGGSHAAAALQSAAIQTSPKGTARAFNTQKKNRSKPAARLGPGRAIQLKTGSATKAAAKRRARAPTSASLARLGFAAALSDAWRSSAALISALKA